MRKRAFTLLELLVVTAIIALLAAILFPLMARSRAKARRTSCLAQMSQMARAAMLYKADYDGCYPQWHMSPGPRTDIFELRHWHILLYPYTKSWEVFRCPDCAADHDETVPGKTRRMEDGAFLGRTCDLYIPPDLPGSNAAALRQQYRFAPRNESWVGTGGYGWNACVSRVNGQGVRDAALPSPATTLMIGEITKNVNGAAFYPPPSNREYVQRHGIQDGCGQFNSPELYAYWWQASRRHGNGSNLTYFDGHCGWAPSAWLAANPQIFHLDSTRQP